MYSSKVNAEEPEASAELEEWNWKFEYTGTEQVFKAPYSGIYLFEVYGAQGESTDSNEGGKGGKVTAAIRLSRNEEIIIYVGGSDGYNGGGTGTLAYGGGATDIRQGGKELPDRILIAAGGGGANNKYPGGSGGVNTSTSVITDNSSEGESSTEGAGGGGGYEGGTAGIEHIIAHTHTSACANKTENIVHNWRVTGRGDTKNWTGPIVQGEGDTHYIRTSYPVVDQHGHTGEIEWYSYVTGVRSHIQHTWSFLQSDEYGGASGLLVSEPLGFTFSTGKTVSVPCTDKYNEYDVKQASGGTNFYDEEHCTNAISEAGIQEGDGACSIKINTLYNLYFDGVESLNIYYDGIKVKRIYYKGKLIYLE